MAVTATTVAAATTMLAAVAAVFLTLVLCFYLFLCAKRYRPGGPPPPPPPHAGRGGGAGVRAWLRVAFGFGGSGGARPDPAEEWCYHDGGLDDKSMAKLPRREVRKGEDALDCAVCLAEVAPGETARVLPRCGHAFHVDCVDVWLRSHSTCPLCRCPAVDDPPVPVRPPAVPTPVADPESPNFPTNVLFFGSQDEVSTGRSHSAAAVAPMPAEETQEHVAVDDAARACAGLRRLIGCGGATPPTQPPHRCDRCHQEEEEEDIEMGLAAGESSASPQPGS